MRLFKSICICLLLLLQFSSVSLALQHQWQWIESNDNYGFFLDTQTIRPHYMDGNNADYADVWMMVKYSYAGAKKTLDSYGNTYVKPEKLQDGYGMYRLRLYFWSGNVQRNFVGLYMKDGTLLVQYTKAAEKNVDTHHFYQPVMYYTIDYLTGNHEYAIYNHGKNCYKVYNETKKGKDKFYIPKNSIKTDGDDIYFKCQGIYYNSNDEFKNADIWQIKYNRISNSMTYLSAEVYGNSNRSWSNKDLSDMPAAKRTVPVIPDSIGERFVNDVKKFCQENNAFVNRYNHKLLEVKKK